MCIGLMPDIGGCRNRSSFKTTIRVLIVREQSEDNDFRERKNAVIKALRPAFPTTYFEFRDEHEDDLDQEETARADILVLVPASRRSFSYDYTDFMLDECHDKQAFLVFGSSIKFRLYDTTATEFGVHGISSSTEKIFELLEVLTNHKPVQMYADPVKDEIMDTLRNLIADKVKHHKKAIKAKLADLGCKNLTDMHPLNYEHLRRFLVRLPDNTEEYNRFVDKHNRGMLAISSTNETVVDTETAGIKEPCPPISGGVNCRHSVTFKLSDDDALKEWLEADEDGVNRNIVADGWVSDRYDKAYANAILRADTAEQRNAISKNYPKQAQKLKDFNFYAKADIIQKGGEDLDNRLKRRTDILPEGYLERHIFGDYLATEEMVRRRAKGGESEDDFAKRKLATPQVVDTMKLAAELGLASGQGTAAAEQAIRLAVAGERMASATKALDKALKGFKYHCTEDEILLLLW